MAYGLDHRLFLENGPTKHAADAIARSSSTAFRAWRSLNQERRFELVERALRKAANDDVFDGFPAAL